LYFHGLLLDAANYATSTTWKEQRGKVAGILTGLSFTGGACVGLAPYLLFVTRRRGWIWWAIIFALVSSLLMWTNPYSQLEYAHGPITLGTRLQLFGCIGCGLAVLMLAARELWQEVSIDSVLLALWVFGTFLFASVFNWSVNGRSVLPVVPAAAILMARRLDEKSTEIRGWEWAGLAPAILLSMLCAVADTWSANLPRVAARQFLDRAGRYESTVWINGHWGFQYYMQLGGAKPIDKLRFRFRRGELVAWYENSNMIEIEYSVDDFEPVEKLGRAPFPFLTVMSARAHAGFYSDVFGPLPFVFTHVIPDDVQMIRLTNPNLREPQLEKQR